MDDIEMTRCESTLIRAHGHDPKTDTLQIEFKDGAVWRYAGVDAEKYEQLKGCDSIGKFFHTRIKTHHTGTRVPPKEVPDDTQ